MEITLNLVWAVLAIVLVRLWERHAPREGASRRMQFATMAVLILFLLPVISITDDLQSVQNFGEEVVSQRQDHVVPHFHHYFPALPNLSHPAFAELLFGFSGYVSPSSFSVPTVDNPFLAVVQNRPPPAA